MLLVLSALLLVTGSPATGQEPAADRLRITPAPGSSTEPGGSYFVIDSKPGRTVRQRLQITNTSNRPADVEVSRVDATTASRGGVAFELASDPVDDEGSWITIRRERLSLRPGQTAEVPFRVDVPTETEPGVHLAGIAVRVVDGSKADPSPTSGGAVVDVQSRFVVAVQVNLPGSTTPELVIAGVEPVIRTEGISLEVLIENVGFGLTKAEGVLELPEEGFEEALPVATFVPGTSIRYPVDWIEDPAEGEYTARVDLNYSEDDPDLLTGKASWEGTFVIGEAQVGEVDRLQGGLGFNWWLVILPAVALLIIAAFLLWRRKRTPSPVSSPATARPQPQAPKQTPTGGYTGGASGTFGSGGRPQKQPAPQTPQQRPSGTPPPPPPPPPKQGT